LYDLTCNSRLRASDLLINVSLQTNVQGRNGLVDLI